MKRQSVYALVLAAGTSSRMGKPKQLLKLKGEYLLERVIRQVMSHPFERVIIVLGYKAEEIRQHLNIDSPRIEWLYHEGYRNGQSTSFLAGLKEIPKTVSAVMVFLGDQPFIKDTTIHEVFSKGLEVGKTGNKGRPFVIRPYFEHTPGHPVYWGNINLLSLPELSGDKGGLQLMQSVVKRPITVHDAYIAEDIDTPEDYIRAKSMSHFLT